jgi:hypothetical protein
MRSKLVERLKGQRLAAALFQAAQHVQAAAEGVDGLHETSAMRWSMARASGVSTSRGAAGIGGMDFLSFSFFE